MKNNKHKGIPDIGRGVQIGYTKQDPQTIKGRSKHKCAYYNEETRMCSALKNISCVGTSHNMCKYLEKEDFTNPGENPIPSGVVNNGTKVILKEIYTGDEITIEVNSHKNPEHKKLLGKKLKSNSIIENWEGHTYIVWEVKKI